MMNETTSWRINGVMANYHVKASSRSTFQSAKSAVVISRTPWSLSWLNNKDGSLRWDSQEEMKEKPVGKDWMESYGTCRFSNNLSTSGIIRQERFISRILNNKSFIENRLKYNTPQHNIWIWLIILSAMQYRIIMNLQHKHILLFFLNKNKIPFSPWKMNLIELITKQLFK